MRKNEICKFCNQEFQRHPKESQKRKRRFCSQLCYHRWRAKEGITTGQFAKGHQTWNKGEKGLRLSPATEFKKGQKGINWKPVGTITERKDKSGKTRKWIKISEPNRWLLYAQFVWIGCRGVIPDGFLLHHIDCNSLNDDVKNLALVTRSGHMNIHRKDLLAGKR